MDHKSLSTATYCTFITDIYYKLKHNYVPCCHWYSYHGLHLCVFVSQSLWNNIIIVVAKQVPECDVEVVVECEGCGTKLRHLKTKSITCFKT